MAFNYIPTANNMGQGVGSGLDYRDAQGQQGYSMDLSQKDHIQPTSGPQIDPIQLMQLYKKFAGSDSPTIGGLSGLFGMNGGELIGSSLGAIPADENGGASFGLGGSLVGGGGEVGTSTYAGDQGASGGNWGALKSIIMNNFMK